MCVPQRDTDYYFSTCKCIDDCVARTDHPYYGDILDGMMQVSKDLVRGLERQVADLDYQLKAGKDTFKRRIDAMRKEVAAAAHMAGQVSLCT